MAFTVVTSLTAMVVLSWKLTLLSLLLSQIPAAVPAAPARAAEEGQVSLLDMGAAQVADRLRQVDVNVLTPIEAMNLVYELKQML